MISQKTSLSIAAVAALAALAFTGCASSGKPSTSISGDSAAITIGISQIAAHPSLDASRAGFKKAIIDAGYVEGKTVIFDEQNAQGDLANASTIAGKFASAQVDLVLAVATPMAQAAAQSITNIPILFTAVTDPVAADLVTSMDKPGGNISGTSDINPVEDQIRLIQEAIPALKTIGVVYSSGEVNSEVQVDLARTAAKKLGVELKEKTISTTADLGTAVESLGSVDAIFVPTDNNVVTGLSTVLKYGEDKSIPVFAAEGDSVENGAVATLGIDYEKLGYQTGEMAVKILKDKADPATLPVETASDISLIINPAAAKKQGLTFPESITSRAGTVID